MVHERTVQDLLRRAASGTAVHLATYTFTLTSLARACIAAADRGVDVNVLVDECSAETDATRLLLEGGGDRASVTVGGATGDGIDHNKFLLAEELRDGTSKVVLQSSSNFTIAQRYRHNTSVVVRDDGDLYDAYRMYWDDMVAGETDPNYNRTEETDAATVYFSPRSDVDTHLEALERVTPSRDATIRFVVSIWTPRRSAVVERIAELVEGGCTVEVILDEESRAIVPHLRRAGADVLEYPSTALGELTPGQSPNVHSKTMLVDADVDADGETKRRRLVYTGSQNLSEAGLCDNHEALLRIEDDDVYDQFVGDWERVYEQGRRLVGGEISALVRRSGI
ncbi:phosphatidylserine/phosphatidylglycerophosphate/cardiolipin synthase family protein [Natrialbaceae archaeon GCM10025810]|uniref:phospholipase D-like domain-containing protein n=1 Tax=Halovalidus salilacus TaxID=3075124 RepID=UPI003622FB4D